MGFWSAVSKTLSDTWALELLFLLLSWVSAAATVILLLRYDQKPVFTLLDVSLNTVISILTTVFESALLFVLSSCLGQWTYISFSSRRHRKLFDFVTYDSASRGRTGSLFLLWRTRLRSWAVIGAFTTLLSFFVAPFFQQIINLGEAQTATALYPASVPRAVHYDKGLSVPIEVARGPTPAHIHLKSLPDFSMHAAIFSGLSGAKGVQAVDAQCPSAPCQWEKYHTLGVCSTFSDLTSSISKATIPWHSNSSGIWQVYKYDDARRAPLIVADGTPIDYYRLPNGLYIEEGPIGVIGLVSQTTTNRTDSLSFNDKNTLLWSITVLQRSTATAPAQSINDFKAYEIGLSLCVKEITSTLINGTLSETVRDIKAPIIRGGTSKNKNTTDLNIGMLAQTWKDARDDLEFEGGFTISQRSLNGMAVALLSTFESRNDTESIVSNAVGDDRESFTGIYVTFKKETEDDLQYSPNSMDSIYKSPDPKATFESIAESMTNNLRANDAQSNVATGTQSITVYRVRWAWISLPATTLCGGTVFLFLAMYMTRRYRAPLWKSSTLAMLKCGAQTADTLRDHEEVSTMEDAAEKTLVAIFPAEDESEHHRRPARSIKSDEPHIQEVSTQGLEDTRL